ncbi:MAG: stage V sporulation protein AC [Oscillospiraceae bacterium]|nr:stage V sporulation protein AC [Oscillospiraceae bacterium]
MNLSKKAYADYAKERAPASRHLRNLIFAFLIGGAICTIGQGILMWYRKLGLTVDSAGAATSATLIALSALLTGFGVYDDVAKFAGAGTLVPITGFANSVVSAALEFKSEGVVLGMCAKMFTLAGPVIVFGTTASVVYGLVYWLFIIPS